MAITPIQVRPKERKLSAMEKIALALGITEKAVGIGLAVPQFLQQRDLAKQTAGLKQADLDLRTQKLEQDRVIAVAEGEAKAMTAKAKANEAELNKTKLMLEHGLEPAPDQPEAEFTFDKPQAPPSLLGQPQGLLEGIQPAQAGIDVSLRPDPDATEFPGLGRVKPSPLGGEAPDVGELTDVEKQELKGYMDDYQLASPDQKPRFQVELGGKVFGFVDKPEESKLKELPPNTVLKVNEGNAIPKMLDNVENVIGGNEEIFGPAEGRIRSINPFDTQAQTVDAEMRATSQAFGRFMEGGVLRKEDEAKYRRMFPKLSDIPEVAKSKLRVVRKLLKTKQKSDLEALKAQGFDTVGLKLPEDEVKVDPKTFSREEIIAAIKKKKAAKGK